MKVVREENLRLSLPALYPQRFVLSSQNGKTHSARYICLLLFCLYFSPTFTNWEYIGVPFPYFFIFVLPSKFKLLLICWYPSCPFQLVFFRFLLSRTQSASPLTIACNLFLLKRVNEVQAKWGGEGKATCSVDVGIGKHTCVKGQLKDLKTHLDPNCHFFSGERGGGGVQEAEKGHDRSYQSDRQQRKGQILNFYGHG